jgi:hypothetical protein
MPESSLEQNISRCVNLLKNHCCPKQPELA